MVSVLRGPARCDRSEEVEYSENQMLTRPMMLSVVVLDSNNFTLSPRTHVWSTAIDRALTSISLSDDLTPHSTLPPMDANDSR